MITVLMPDDSPMTQSAYDDALLKLDFSSLPCCSCGAVGDLHVHGYYKRTIRCSAGRCILRVCRLKCFQCGKTHAVLPSFIVPYSQISLPDQLTILAYQEHNKNYQDILESNLELNEIDIYHIKRRYKIQWQMKLLACQVKDISISPEKLTTQCFTIHKRQFMQMKSTSNVLIPTVRKQ